MKRVWRTGVLACALVAAHGISAGGQSVVRGVVRSAVETGSPVADVTITLEPTAQLVHTDSLGRFRFLNVAAGTYFIRLQRLGFELRIQRLDIGANEARTLELSLRPSAQQMATVRIAGKVVTYPARLAEPYARLARGAGDYFTREQIDSLFPQDVNSLLIRLPGVHASGRDNDIEIVRCRVEGHLQVWVDGTRRTSYSLGGANVSAAEALRDITPSSIQLIEVYRGPSRIPATYLDDACAVILIWSK